MKRRALRALTTRSAAFALATTAVSTTAGLLAGGAAHASTPQPAATTALCTAPTAHASLAAQLSRDIAAAMHGRAGVIGVRVEDRRTGVECRYNEGHQFHSASVVKATILAALLRWHQETHTGLSAREKSLADLMITHSDNNAASALWSELGPSRFQHFLTLASMTETVPGPGGYWGLTKITARDELQLMRLLTAHNSVLSDGSRAYELNLMNHVLTSQKWGVPAGAPSGLAVYVKNGWLPDPSLWVINSIGAFEGHGRDYMITVLTSGNPSMSYGVTTVERIAEVTHRDLNAGLPSAGTPLPGITVPRTAQVPDEAIPASAFRLP